MGSPGVGKMFDIDEKYSDKDALKIMSVRYSAYLSRYSQYMKVTFATEVSSRSIAEIEERSNELTGIDVSTKSIRVYKNSEAMSHVIGYTGTINTEELDDYNKGKRKATKIIMRWTMRSERQALKKSWSLICTAAAAARA